MGRPLHAGLRLLRAGCVAVVVLGLAAAAHVAGHGTLPHPAILAAVAVFVALASTVVTRRRLESPLLFGVLTASQVVLHHVLGWLAAPTCVVVPAASAHLDHAVPAAMSCVAPLALADGAAASGASMPVLMVVAHLGAALLAAAVLSSGDRALWALADGLRPLFSAPARTALLVPRVRNAPLAASTLLPHQPPVLRSVRRRGPPQGFPATC